MVRCYNPPPPTHRPSPKKRCYLQIYSKFEKHNGKNTRISQSAIDGYTSDFTIDKSGTKMA